MAEHNKDFAQGKTIHLKGHTGVLDGNYSLYEPAFYLGLRHLQRIAWQTLPTFSRLFLTTAGEGYLFDRTEDRSFKHLDSSITLFKPQNSISTINFVTKLLNARE